MMVRLAVVASAFLALSPACMAQALPSHEAKPALIAPKGIDMTQVIRDEKGDPVQDTSAMKPSDIKDGKCTTCADLTLGRVVYLALVANYPDEQNLDGGQKFARYALAISLQKSTDAAITVEDLAVVKRLVGKYWAASVVGQAWAMLDPNATPGHLQ